jgi:hypothetical protein
VLAQELGRLAGRLTPAQADRLARDILFYTRSRLTAPGLTFDADSVFLRARLLGDLAERGGPARAADLCAPLVQPILTNLSKTPDPQDVSLLARALAELAERLAPAQAAEACTRGAQPVLGALTRASTPGKVAALVQALRKLARWLSPERAAELGARGAPSALAALARATDRDEVASLVQSLRELAGWVDPPALVELLKHPLCVGAGREVLLGALGRRLGPPLPRAAMVALAFRSPLAVAAGVIGGESLYPAVRRPFAGTWEAVDRLRSRHPELKLTALPVRPAR